MTELPFELKARRRVGVCCVAKCKQRNQTIDVPVAGHGALTLCTQGPNHLAVLNNVTLEKLGIDIEGYPLAEDGEVVSSDSGTGETPHIVDGHLVTYQNSEGAPVMDAYPTQGSVLTEIQPIYDEAAEMAPQLSDIEIDSQETLDAVGELLKHVKGRIKELEAKRTSVTKPLLDAKRGIDSWFKPTRDLLTDAEGLLKRKISEYTSERERAKVEALQAGNHDDALAIETPTLPQGVQQRTIWRFQVTDLSAVPREYLIVDAQKVQAHVNVHKGATAIPGIQAYPETSVRSGSL